MIVKIKKSDVSDISCDVLVLKYAQGRYGVDAEIAGRLKAHSPNLKIEPKPDSYILIPSNGVIYARYVLFVGVTPLNEFDYREIRKFCIRALSAVKQELPTAMHIAMTMHGVNCGLDERESFSAQIAGIGDSDQYTVGIKQITIIERDGRRANRLREILRQIWPQVDQNTSATRRVATSITAGNASNMKPHIFVAMPFAKEMEDVYIFGIQGPINTAGYLCERVDMEIFSGDILGRIKSRIETAELVVADLTGGNPNVYLEVGYAWGKSRPTLLIARQGGELKFDVRGQRCIIYESIADLANKLTKDLSQIQALSNSSHA